MHQEQINVSHIQVVEGVLERLRDIVRVVFVVPQLGRDKELLAGDSALFDGISDSLFGSVAGITLTYMPSRKSRCLWGLTFEQCQCGDIRP